MHVPVTTFGPKERGRRKRRVQLIKTKYINLQRMYQHNVCMSSSHQVAEGSSYSVNRDPYITMVNIAVSAATGKTAYAVSFDPGDANTNDLVDGDFATCITTDVATDPW